MEKANFKFIEFSFSGFDGKEKKASLVPLKRKESAEVFHSVLQKVFSNGGDPEMILREMAFSDLWLLASKILRGAVIDRTNEINELEDTEYFETHPEELLILVLHGVINNWPNFFRREDADKNKAG